MARHIALILAYCGTEYHGWQIQKNLTTVQQTICDAVSSIVNETVKITGCGRTDAGVHARRYAADFFTNSLIKTEHLPTALNSLLPRDISVFSALEVSEDFHAIRSCLKKEYVYEIDNEKYRNPFLKDLALHYPYPLDIKLINEAAAHFIGKHDFNSMRTNGTQLKSTVRTIYDCRARRNENLISVAICADGFLYNMARAIVGTLLYVAQGKILSCDIPDILESRDRARAGATAPAHGLYLSRIWYDKKYNLDI